jgi:hypothetical protein
MPRIPLNILTDEDGAPVAFARLTIHEAGPPVGRVIATAVADANGALPVIDLDEYGPMKVEARDSGGRFLFSWDDLQFTASAASS